MHARYDTLFYITVPHGTLRRIESAVHVESVTLFLKFLAAIILLFLGLFSYYSLRSILQQSWAFSTLLHRDGWLKNRGVQAFCQITQTLFAL